MRQPDRNITQNSLVRIRHKRLDDERSKDANPVGRHRRAEDHGGPEPRLGIPESLEEVRVAPLARHDALLVVAESLDGDDLVLVGEEPGLGRRVGHPQEHDDAEEDGDDAEEEEDDLRLALVTCVW